MDLARLKDPLPYEAIEWRIGQSGKNGERYWAKVLAYLTNRAIMDRLDEVCGPENWKNAYAPGPAGGVVCTIFIRIDGEWVGKTDGAENTDIEQVKGGLSDAMKRAAVQWGIGRYLYNLGETWAECTTEKQRGDGWHWAKTKDGSFYWKAPGLTKEFLPADSPPPPKKPTSSKPAAARAPSAAEVVRGPEGSWIQWTVPVEDAANDPTHVFWVSAVKGLLEKCGARSTRPLRTLCAWLGPDGQYDPAAVIAHPIAAKDFWDALMARSNEVPFHRMLHEATEATAKAEV